MRLLVSLTAACALAFASASTAQVPDEPIKWALALPSAIATTTPGGTITLQLTATIDEGWHLYATTLGPGGPIPTAISVPKGQAFTLSGEISEPTPTSAFDANFNTTLEFHLDKATFGIPLKVSTTSGYGDLPARVAISFQTCNDKFCLPPKQVVTTVPVTVKSGAMRNGAVAACGITR